jgi:oxygen-independent coproporphyrinogen-3 oxidase
MLQAGSQRIRAAGLAPYYLYRQKDVAGGLENTGYARPGSGCLYNVGMMSDARSVIGLGSGAMSKRVINRNQSGTTGLRLERLPNPRDLAVYIDRVDALAERKVAFFTADPCAG